MHLIGMLIIGLIAGALAKLLTPGRDGGGIFITMILGVVGAFVAGFLGRAIGMYREPGSGPGLIAATIGAVVVLAVYHLVTRRALHSH